jgi:3-oxoacyl-[acyl-carrier protein] reductase
MAMELGLKGRTALVTGASKGIGRAIARGLASEGVNLVLLARGKDALEATAAELQSKYGVKALAASADITSTDSVKAAADAAKAAFGTVHIVVNNAGNPMRRMDRQILWSDTEWIGDLDGKLIGSLRVTQAFLPLMPSDGTGRIINISGTASTIARARSGGHRRARGVGREHGEAAERHEGRVPGRLLQADGDSVGPLGDDGGGV